MVHTRQTIMEAVGRHPIHPFPARMAPGIALNVLADSKKPLKVLDPMMGSGTVLAVARAHGHQAIGVDLDPLAVLLTRVWITPLDKTAFLKKGQEVLKRAKALAKGTSLGNAYPPRSDEATRKFLRYWFDPYTRRQLAALSQTIGRVRCTTFREALWCAFSRLVITKSVGASLAMDLSHSRPHKVYDRAPIRPFNHFLLSLKSVAANSIAHNDPNRGPAAKAILGDARKLAVANCSVDVVLTSPPYLNAIDYMRCSKFTLVWMGYSTSSLSETRSASVGAEAAAAAASGDRDVRKIISELKLKPSLSSRNEALLARYIWDMKKAVSEVERVLVRGGTAIYVVGDCTVKGTFISNSKIVEIVAQRCGLTRVARMSRALPENRRYLPPPKKRSVARPMDARMRREVLLTFAK